MTDTKVDYSTIAILNTKGTRLLKVSKRRLEEIMENVKCFRTEKVE